MEADKLRISLQLDDHFLGFFLLILLLLYPIKMKSFIAIGGSFPGGPAVMLVCLALGPPFLISLLFLFSHADPEGKYEALDKYGIDLTELARRGKLDPVIGRDDEIRRCIQILSRRTKNNPVIIGEPGVGKTAIVEGYVHYYYTILGFLLKIKFIVTNFMRFLTILYDLVHSV